MAVDPFEDYEPHDIQFPDLQPSDYYNTCKYCNTKVKKEGDLCSKHVKLYLGGNANG